ncbi:hypothetical protein NDU88_006528 [Pleurodeles waltl]|uniref:Uncharacterized protein n=1 Tax=Pleurodeles waltl TaxID=8319 RepID=A0AAV7TYM9_PLEWA|nr:hypothetical protein NDU88_006528 [Pleurodeles waltl]
MPPLNDRSEESSPQMGRPVFGEDMEREWTESLTKDRERTEAGKEEDEMTDDHQEPLPHQCRTDPNTVVS